MATDGQRTDEAMLALSALAPACVAAAHLTNIADAAHDAGTIRVLGLAAEPWRALDVAVGVLLSEAPVGSRVARAGLGGALVLAAAGVALYVIVRRLLGACARTRRLGFVVGAIATTTPLVAFPWQVEGATVGGAASGALLVLLSVALFAHACSCSEAGGRASWTAAAFAIAAACGHEPLVGVAAIGGCAAFAAMSPDGRRSLALALRTHGRGIGSAAIAGLAPFLLALARTRGSGAPLASALAVSWAGERGASAIASPVALVRGEMGVVLFTLALAGLVLAALVRGARPLACALAAVTVLGLASGWLGAPLGPTRYGAPVLAALAAAGGLAGVAMQAIVRAIATARVPLARASAAMVVLLELVLPVDAADEAFVRAMARATGATAVWDDLAWGVLLPRTVVLVVDRRVYERALAAQASGTLRGDVSIVPAYAHGALAAKLLARDPDLVPVWRDLELIGAPGEASLSTLATVRPLAMAFEPRWGSVVARHLVPVALFDRFEPEPRGSSDRRRALDAFAPELARVTALAGRDPELAAATAYLLRARASAIATTGDRELAGRALADAKAFLASEDGAR